MGTSETRGHPMIAPELQDYIAAELHREAGGSRSGASFARSGPSPVVAAEEAARAEAATTRARCSRRSSSRRRSSSGSRRA
eukprot:6764036-Pyramimonas_sp.AAC.1